MRMRKAPAKIPSIIAALFITSVVAFAATTFLTVSPTNLQGWQLQVTTAATATPTPSVTFVNGPGVPPLGTGSAELRVGANGNDAAQLRHPGYAGTRLPNPTPTVPAANELSSLSYSTYTQQDGSGGQSPYIILQIDTDGDAGIEDLLFFEPVYQSAAFCPSNPQPALVVGQWQTWDAFNGCWYSVFGTAGSGPGTNTVSLRTLSAALPTGVIANSSPSGLGGVRIVTGFGAGAWDNFIGNVDAFRIGVGANDTIYNFDPTATTPGVGPPSTFLISEARFAGPANVEDEFIEIYNNTDTAHVVSPPDGSSGYALAGSDGVVRHTIPFGTVIPARGHYLVANSDGYSLGTYAASSNTTATPDATYTDDIPHGSTGGVALFQTSNAANFNLANQLDAFGFTGAPALYREGAGHPSPSLGVALDYSFLRKVPGACTGSVGGIGDNCVGATAVATAPAPPSPYPQDTNDNAADFFYVSVANSSVGAGQRLGAPGPENRTSPIVRQFTGLTPALIDPQQCQSCSPNRVRDTSSYNDTLTDPSNPMTFPLGRMMIRRTYTNNTGAPVTRLRFRVVDITTAPAASGVADLRVISSPDELVPVTGGGMVQARGLRLEQPPNQLIRGGYNSSLSADSVSPEVPVAAVRKGILTMPSRRIKTLKGERLVMVRPSIGTEDTVTLNEPLQQGQPISVQFWLGVAQNGKFRYFVNIELLP